MAFDIISPHHPGVVLPPKAEVEIFQSTVPLCSLPNHDEAFYELNLRRSTFYHSFTN